MQRNETRLDFLKTNEPGEPKTMKRRVSSPLKEESSEPNKPLKFRLDKLERSHPYLVERGLTTETLVDFGAGFCAEGIMAGRIAIPIHNPKGDVVAYAGRLIGEPTDDNPKYKLPPGFRKSLELINFFPSSTTPSTIAPPFEFANEPIS